MAYTESVKTRKLRKKQKGVYKTFLLWKRHNLEGMWRLLHSPNDFFLTRLSDNAYMGSLVVEHTNLYCPKNSQSIIQN